MERSSWLSSECNLLFSILLLFSCRCDHVKHPCSKSIEDIVWVKLGNSVWFVFDFCFWCWGLNQAQAHIPPLKLYPLPRELFQLFLVFSLQIERKLVSFVLFCFVLNGDSLSKKGNRKAPVVFRVTTVWFIMVVLLYLFWLCWD